jgi:hypothetical protein
MLRTFLNLTISWVRFSGCRLRGNMALYTMRTPCPVNYCKKWINPRVWAARSLNWIIRRQRVSFAQKTTLASVASRMRPPTR